MTQWQAEETYPKETIPARIRPWLLADDSMTEHLRAAQEGKVWIDLRFQEWQMPDTEEQQGLDIVADMPAMIREVDIYCGDTAVVFGRTVLPEITLENHAGLKSLGTKSLGDFLFANPNLRRTRFEIAPLKKSDFSYQRACATNLVQDEIVWARRSIFYLGDYPLLLTEAFYPTVPSEAPC